MSSISLISVVRNEERYIARMIESAAKIVNEIVIVDQQSEDRTQEIAVKVAHNYGLPLTYFVDDKVGYAELSRQKAIDLATSEYILLLDGDEMLTNHEALLLAEGDGYYLSRKTVVHMDSTSCIEYVGHEQLRYARRQRCGHVDSIHDTIRVNGHVGFIPRAILELKTVENTLSDYKRYETIQHHDFQVDFIKHLEEYLRNGPPETPWIPPYWERPEAF